MIRLCATSELGEGQSRGFSLADLKLIAVRREGRVYLYRNRCPHRGVPLEWQADRFLDESGSMLQCATHGALFLIESGECVVGPCAGQFLQPLPGIEQDDSIWLQTDRQSDS
ncbi:Rieske family iron-sulfur cluster-binding protein [Pseudomonas sp. BAY1663]|uniref:Rieske (2Fe-2S) protein n=1 Tax=Stutzerimonas stutzeri TaxID=316 RepID=A0A2N8SVL9_STUST|nr:MULTISPECIES: Rieske (2Fe-2S) protein [Pseudomonadaceae]EXF43532.1 Rieske family iron-sulfur cluster-binding protein [Pseudomonas sp. BAY1663]MCQ4326784.1 Rieske (2Fe-2S) protein [Stutzerimonas stutzeri]PNG06499.1 Rieske (2Fe-2S) protein [Stutzerimonas stutzeri]